MLLSLYKSLFQSKPLIIVLDSDNSSPPLAAAVAVQWIPAIADSGHSCGIAMDSALVAVDLSIDSS